MPTNDGRPPDSGPHCELRPLACGAINNGLTLSERTWTCQCGAVHDRDRNAAVNLQTAMHTGIEDALVSPETRGDPMSPLRWTTKSLAQLVKAGMAGVSR